MRRERWLAVLAALVAGCATMRPLPPQEGEPTRSPDAVVTRAPEPTPDALGCLTHPAVDAWEDRLRRERRLWASTMHGVKRGRPHMARVREILAAAGLPEEIALLPVIESGYRTRARGSSGSRGLWQFEAPTARRFGLVVTSRRDDRLDPERSTRAAARYLRYLHARYRDWPLALAAYNAGEGRVNRALARRPGASYWDLAAARYLPPISRDYVPRFLAIVRVVDGSEACA